jgi:uncharacterized protein
MILFCLYMLLTVGGSYSFYHYFFKKIIDKAESPDAAYNNLQSYTRGPIIGALIAAFLVPGAILCLWLVVTRKKLRAMPRVSKKNGKPMHRLTEAEEDKFLSSGQILEEKLKSRDYDVWVTDDEDDVAIINYLENAINYTQCSSCQFVTDHLVKVVTIKKATTSRAGQQKCFYKCLQCSNEREALEKIPRISLAAVVDHLAVDDPGAVVRKGSGSYLAHILLHSNARYNADTKATLTMITDEIDKCDFPLQIRF